MEEISYLLLFTFSHSIIFTLVAARISHFLTTANKFLCCSSNKQLLIFRSRLSVALFLVELRWPVAHFIFSLYSKFMDMTINLSLILQTTRIQKKNFRFPFSSLLTLQLSLFYKTRVAMRFPANNLELHLGCHTCWLSYFTLVCLWCGRTVGWAYGHVITKISRMGRLPNFLTHGAPLRAR